MSSQRRIWGVLTIIRYFRGKGNFLGKVNYINKDFTKLNCKGVYDLVHNEGVVEHFDDEVIVKMIQKMAYCTKKGGSVVVGVPNFFSPDMINIWRVNKKGDEHFIDKADLMKFLKRAGLVNICVETSTFFYPSFIPQSFVMHSVWLEYFLGKTCGLGFLVIGKGTKA